MTCPHYEASMHATAPQVWCVLCQVHRPQPLHHSVVGPLDHLTGRELVLKAQTGKKRLFSPVVCTTR